VIVGDVGDQRDVDGVTCEPAPQNAAARRLEDRDLHLRAAQHFARRGGPGPVAFAGGATGDGHLVRARRPDDAARLLRHAREQPGRGRLPIRARHHGDGNRAERRPVDAVELGELVALEVA